MRRFALVTAILLVPATALAGKPSAADAKKAAQAWIDAALSEDDDAPAKAAGLSVTPFFSVDVQDGPDAPPCPAATATDAPSLAKGIACLHDHMSKDGTLKPLTAKHRKDYGSELKADLKKLEATAKSVTLVNLEAECSGTFNDVVFAVVKDKDGTFKVAGVMSLNGECGE
jgi:hypothetical protein